jgi:hypothetical protein
VRRQIFSHHVVILPRHAGNPNDPVADRQLIADGTCRPESVQHQVKASAA